MLLLRLDYQVLVSSILAILSLTFQSVKIHLPSHENTQIANRKAHIAGVWWDQAVISEHLNPNNSEATFIRTFDVIIMIYWSLGTL